MTNSASHTAECLRSSISAQNVEKREGHYHGLNFLSHIFLLTLFRLYIFQYVFQTQKEAKFVDDICSYNQPRIKKIVGRNNTRGYCLLTRN